MCYKLTFHNLKRTWYVPAEFTGSEEAMIQYAASVLLEKSNKIHYCSIVQRPPNTGEITHIERSKANPPSVNCRLHYYTDILSRVPLTIEPIAIH